MTAAPRTIALVGPRGAGKTTVGRAVAHALGLPFVDADAALADAAGMPAGTFLLRCGEPAFRQVEERVSAPLLARPGVVALGGGAVLVPALRALLMPPEVLTVLLLADPAELVRRLAADPTPRPALTELPRDAEVAALLAARLPLYRSVAQIECDTSARPVAGVVDELLRRVRALCAARGPAP